MMKLDWSLLYAGKITRDEINRYCTDRDWQALRAGMKGLPLERKYECLCQWLDMHLDDRAAQVQVTNYVTALSRSGLIKREDYRRE